MTFSISFSFSLATHSSQQQHIWNFHQFLYCDSFRFVSFLSLNAAAAAAPGAAVNIHIHTTMAHNIVWLRMPFLMFVCVRYFRFPFLCFNSFLFLARCFFSLFIPIPFLFSFAFAFIEMRLCFYLVSFTLHSKHIGALVFFLPHLLFFFTHSLFVATFSHMPSERTFWYEHEDMARNRRLAITCYMCIFQSNPATIIRFLFSSFRSFFPHLLLLLYYT